MNHCCFMIGMFGMMETNCFELAGFCGDGMCISPEFEGSCPTDCGQVIRNGRMLRKGNDIPMFWRLQHRQPDSNLVTRDGGYTLADREMVSQSGIFLWDRAFWDIQ